MDADLVRRQKTGGRKQNCGAAALQVFSCTLFGVLCGMSSPLVAQQLADPTQPPAGIYDMQGGGLGVANVIRPRANNGLQSVIISPQRRAAIINGTTVELGEKIGGAKLIEVNEGGVVLQGNRGKRMLALFPGVNLKMKTIPAQAGPNNIKSANEADTAVPEEKK